MTANRVNDFNTVAGQNILDVVHIVLIRIYEGCKESAFCKPVSTEDLYQKMNIAPHGLGAKINAYLEDKDLIRQLGPNQVDITIAGMIEVQKNFSFGHH